VWGRPIQARNPVSLALSPDGEKIIFAAVDRQLHTVNLAIIASTGPEEVVETLSTVSDPGQSWVLSWDEKSQRVVFGWNGQVRILDLHAKTGTNVAAGFDPTWSPNGRLIAYRSAEGRLQLLDVTTGLHKTTSVEANISSIAHWSPDSNYIFVDEDYGNRSRKRGCPTNSRFVVYRISDTTGKTVYDPCGLRDWYFGWISDATQWMQAAQIAERK
jgi:Tol biopolymer transport system component